MRAKEIGLTTPIYNVDKDSIICYRIKRVENNIESISVSLEHGQWLKFHPNSAISDNGTFRGYLNLEDPQKRQYRLRVEDLEEKRKQLQKAQTEHYNAVMLLSSPLSEPKQW